MCDSEFKRYLVGLMFGMWIEQTLVFPKLTIHDGAAVIR